MMTDTAHWLTWEEMCADRRLQDLPYRIELNELNQIVMSPLHYRHGLHQTTIGEILNRLLPEGKASVETAVMTSKNIKVPDVAWASRDFVRRHLDAFALSESPEICVEVLSPTNTVAEIYQKRGLYFEAGAQEVWICGLEGEMEFHTPAGQVERSVLCPEFPLLIEL